jgi:hypothetical protein
MAEIRSDAMNLSDRRFAGVATSLDSLCKSADAEIHG